MGRLRFHLNAKRTAGACFLALGLVTIFGASRLTYYSETGPGDGFLPLWLGVGITLLALLLLGGRSTREREAQGHAQPGTSPRKPLLLVGLLAAGLFLLPWLGFLLTILALMVALLCLLEGVSLARSLLAAVCTSLVLYLVFTLWLQVPLTVGVFGI